MVNRVFEILVKQPKQVFPQSHIKWHSWLCHTYQCIFFIINIFNFLLKKLEKFNILKIFIEMNPSSYMILFIFVH